MTDPAAIADPLERSQMSEIDRLVKIRKHAEEEYQRTTRGKEGGRVTIQEVFWLINEVEEWRQAAGAGDCSVTVDPDLLREQCVREITDPLQRQQAALAQLEHHREQWKREAGKWAAIRAGAVQELKQGRTWAQVGELLGVSEATAWNIAHPK